MNIKFNSILKLSVVLVLIAVTALTLLSCEKENENDGVEKTITVEVIGKSGESVEKEVKTKANDLGTALVEAGIVENNQDDYGLYILTVYGETADYNVDSSYWALSKDGEYLMTGASQTDIADGEHYELKYTVYE